MEGLSCCGRWLIKAYNIVHLIYRSRQYESHSRTMNSRADHARTLASHEDAVATLKHPEIFERPSNQENVMIIELGTSARLK
jgi:NTE family protein